MSPLRKGLLLAAVNVALVASLSAKLVWDRVRLPRVWTKVAAYDPSLPIRGRYLALQPEVKIADAGSSQLPPLPPNVEKGIRLFGSNILRANLRVEGAELVAHLTEPPQGSIVVLRYTPTGWRSFLQEPVLFFLPEHAPDPWQQAKGGELWVEVTVPAKGPPRPIRLAVKRGANFTPLDVK